MPSAIGTGPAAPLGVPFARAALVIAATSWLIGTCFFAVVFFPSRAPDGTISCCMDSGPVSANHAAQARVLVLVVMAVGAAAVVAQLALARVLRRSRIARGITAGLGSCYLLLGLASIVAWLHDRAVPALLLYAGVSAALGVAMSVVALPSSKRPRAG